MDEPTTLAKQAEIQLDKLGDYRTLYFEGTWHTTGSLHSRATRVSGGFTRLGVRPGDRVIVLMANCTEVTVSYSALWRAGAAITPLIFLVSEDELRHAAEDSGAVGVVTTPEFLAKVGAAVKGLPNISFIVVGPGAPGTDDTLPPDVAGIPVVPYAQLEAGEPAPIVDRDLTDLAALLYTGGTTGRSKGVPLTQRNLFWCGWSSTSSADVSGLTSSITPLPLAHAYGLLLNCMSMHRREPGEAVLMRWFDPVGWLNLVATHRVQRASLVPSMLQMLLAQPLEDYDLSCLITANSGAAPLAAEVRDEFERRVPSATVYEGYGCTESASIISSTPYGRRRIGSVGLPVPGCEVLILDDHGKEVPVGEDGEICVRSPGVMGGYWHAPEVTAAALVDGWLHTGDIGHVDDDGYLYVVDRKKDLIIRGGFNVYPRDVEDVLLTHPAVAMAAVVGKPDPRMGEEVVGFVALRPGASATEAELVAHAKAHLSANKYPRDVRIVAQIPLTSVGKLDRKRLRTLVRDGAGG
jgi:long-chain acyl-CoA synthetase